MTGEITLRGQVLPVGGIKEKILAARRAGIKEVILCWQNEKDISEIDSNFIKGLKFHYVKTHAAGSGPRTGVSRKRKAQSISASSPRQKAYKWYLRKHKFI